jgi:hypothetical protein
MDLVKGRACRSLNGHARLTGSVGESDVTFGLIGNPEPALCQVSKDPGFGLVLRQLHQAMTFYRLISATLCAVHLVFSCAQEELSNLVSVQSSVIELTHPHEKSLRWRGTVRSPQWNRIPPNRLVGSDSNGRTTMPTFAASS